MEGVRKSLIPLLMEAKVEELRMPWNSTAKPSKQMQNVTLSRSMERPALAVRLKIR
jgi:hypothetical protein